MRPKKLVVCGWGPYKAKEEVDFSVFEDRGIFLITGATGAGKTTIFDAITYALYGALSGQERDRERTSIRSDFADEDTPTYVELTMEHGGETYHIRRNPEYQRPKKRSGGFTREKENAVLHYSDGRILEGVREVNAALKELLVLDEQQFKRISMIAQGEFARLLLAKPSEKTEIFRDIFGTSVYDRFLQELKGRARTAFGRVQEQKNKLQEDVRLLTDGLAESGWSQELKEQLAEIVAGENWNYDQLSNCLRDMEQEADRESEKSLKIFEQADRNVEQLASELAGVEEENRRIEQFHKAKTRREQLAAEAPLYQKKQEAYTQAVNAGRAAAVEEKKRQLEQQLGRTADDIERLKKEQASLAGEAESLQETVENAELLQQLLERKKRYEEIKKELQMLVGQLTDQEKKLIEAQEKYLVQEQADRQVRRELEEAEQHQRHNAIGLAAELLEEGKPCPVCGSLHHPSPADVKQQDFSPEKLRQLKAALDKSGNVLKKLYGEAETLKGRVDDLRSQEGQKQEIAAELKAQLDADQSPLGRRYLELPSDKAERLLREELDRAGHLTGLLQEKENNITHVSETLKQLTKDSQQAKQEFEEALKQYGFADQEAYLQAKLDSRQQETLQRELEKYRTEVAGCEELYIHLKETLKSTEPLDLTRQRETLENARHEKETALHSRRLWERLLAEVQKTRRLTVEKLGLIEKESLEYGFVKDLENLASGNNPKRLVFEQYVLAGYFEEILRAANLRFQKMTGGRYEMSRVSQVGDGRVKDNLEIQVLDNYTGKLRSVRTLSGGESFKASLSLALGMSDVIQAMSGGIRVDTLFVDEGFGALDEESLDQACDTLMGLVEKKHMIGIISHVPELRERIGQQLVIEKTGSGSRIRGRSANIIG